jgi:hypothetical protein
VPDTLSTVVAQLWDEYKTAVCQTHTKAILQLRGRLSEPERATGPVRY